MAPFESGPPGNPSPGILRGGFCPYRPIGGHMFDDDLLAIAIAVMPRMRDPTMQGAVAYDHGFLPAAAASMWLEMRAAAPPRGQASGGKIFAEYRSALTFLAPSAPVGDWPQRGTIFAARLRPNDRVMGDSARPAALCGRPTRDETSAFTGWAV